MQIKRRNFFKAFFAPLVLKLAPITVPKPKIPIFDANQGILHGTSDVTFNAASGQDIVKMILYRDAPDGGEILEIAEIDNAVRFEDGYLKGEDVTFKNVPDGQVDGYTIRMPGSGNIVSERFRQSIIANGGDITLQFKDNAVVKFE